LRDEARLSDELEREGAAFDARIRERMEHGHIPDLRRVTPSDWFHNNVWRRPLFVNLLNQRVVTFCVAHLEKESRVLEVGCGPGHMALELARHGFRVTGLDVARDTLEVARNLAKENPYRDSWGSLDYVRADFLEWQPHSHESFDAICYFGALHHFPDAAKALDHTLTLLRPNGRLVAYEPARDWWRNKDAAIMALVRLVLAGAGGWYQDLALPASRAELDARISMTLAEIREARVAGEDVQSPRDNSTYGTEMLAALRERFDELGFAPDTVMFDRVAGGMRLRTDEEAESLARTLQVFELYAIETGLMQPAGFMFAGQRRSA
jgi:2-polyprenyl-3-methyl-5-hydroxy-6-metoxy-1,4-benzoquinol methylase